MQATVTRGEMSGSLLDGEAVVGGEKLVRHSTISFHRISHSQWFIALLFCFLIFSVFVLRIMARITDTPVSKHLSEFMFTYRFTLETFIRRQLSPPPSTGHVIPDKHDTDKSSACIQVKLGTPVRVCAICRFGVKEGMCIFVGIMTVFFVCLYLVHHQPHTDVTVG